MNKILFLLLIALLPTTLRAQERRPIDAQHPLWMIHVDVWNAADPQKIINLIPEDIKPYVCMNLSLSCQYDTEKNVYKMPQNATRTYKSWGTVCQQNGLWFTCQPASGGHTHIQDTDLETFEYFFRHFPNFLGWNFAEQFWGFDEKNSKNDLSSSFQADRIALFAKLVEMSHKYGGFLTVSFCGNIWSHALNPIGMLKRNASLLKACRNYPEAILWLYKYTTSSCFYNNESVTYGPYISGIAKNYGVRYDNCGWNGAMESLVGKDKTKYPIAAGIATVMEQMAVNGGAVWDGPELIWTEDFKETGKTTVDGYSRRNWATFDGFQGAWIDMFRKIIDGTIYIPTREEVMEKTKVIVINNVTTGNDEEKYAAWGDLYDGLYKQNDPMNAGSSYGAGPGQWMSNFCYFKSTGRYGAIPIVPAMYDNLSKAVPVRVSKSAYTSRWPNIDKKVAEFNKYYPEVSTGDLYVNRYRNQLVTYTPYSYLNKLTTATGHIPLLYNTCDSLHLTLGKLGTALMREYADHIDLYLNNYRTDTTTQVKEDIVITGVTSEPSYTINKRLRASAVAVPQWDAENGIYTLSVKHLGGVDVTINCQGNGTDKQTDTLPNTSLTADLPKQPDEYKGEIIIEAEDMDTKSVKNCTTSPYYSHPNVRGHAGNGFVEMGTNTSGALRHQLELKEAGTYRVQVRYMCSSKAGKMRITANGKSTIVNTEKTEDNEWKKVTLEDVALKAGTNNLIVTNVGGLPIFIDQIIYQPADLEPEKFLITIRKASYGSITPNVTEAAEGEEVTLTIKATEGYGLKELQVVNGVNFTMKMIMSLETLDNGNTTLTFIMPDDNVTLQPVFAKGTNVVDGIEELRSSSEFEVQSSELYDLNGRIISRSNRERQKGASLPKGIYIKNGKKIIIRQ